jgi:hypothetical protein
MPARSTLAARTTVATMPACVMLLALALPSSAVHADEAKATPPPPRNAPAKPAPLDLSLGDFSRYFDATELATPLPDELEEIVVRGRKPEPLPEQRVLPQGLGAIFYAVANPLQAWRIFLPDPNVQIPDRSEDDVREPPGAYRARILEPGSIYD